MAPGFRRGLRHVLTCGLYGSARRCIIERMYEDSWRRPIWPPHPPQPGDPPWPLSAVRWIYDNIPALDWRIPVLAPHPWILTVTAASTVRAQIDTLLAEYKMTLSHWGPLLPDDTAKALLDATVAEGKRLRALLADIVALETALDDPLTNRGKPVVVPGAGGYFDLREDALRRRPGPDVRPGS